MNTRLAACIRRPAQLAALQAFTRCPFVRRECLFSTLTAKRSNATQNSNLAPKVGAEWHPNLPLTSLADSQLQLAAAQLVSANHLLQDANIKQGLPLVQEAISASRRSISLNQSCQLSRRILAEALHTSSRIKSELDRPQDALADSLEASSLLEALSLLDPIPLHPLFTDPRSNLALWAANLVNTAYRYIELEEPHKAIETFNKVLKVHGSDQFTTLLPADDFNTRGLVLVELGRLHNSVNEPDQAIVHMKSAIDMARRICSVELDNRTCSSAIPLVSTLTELAQLHFAQDQFEDVEKLGLDLTSVVARVSSLSPQSQFPEVVNEAASFFLGSSMPEVASQLVSRLLNLPLSTEDRARALFVKAAALLDLGLASPQSPSQQTPSAIIQQSLELYRSLGSPPSQMACTLSELARVLFTSGQLQECRGVSEEAVQVQRRAVLQIGDPSEHLQLAQLLNELSQVCLSLEDFDAVLGLSQEAKVICNEQLDNPVAHSLLAESVFARIKALVGLKRWEEAVAAVDEGHAVFESQIEDEADVEQNFEMLLESTELVIVALEVLGREKELRGARKLLDVQREIRNKGLGLAPAPP